MYKYTKHTDSGFNPALATGVIAAVENDQESIRLIKETYFMRMTRLVTILKRAGIKMAVRPQAGFFSLWQTPTRAFGQEVKCAGHFNKLMINETGIVGVHFEPYMRYSTCAPLEDSSFLDAIEHGFTEAKVAYN